LSAPTKPLLCCPRLEIRRSPVPRARPRGVVDPGLGRRPVPISVMGRFWSRAPDPVGTFGGFVPPIADRFGSQCAGVRRRALFFFASWCRSQPPIARCFAPPTARDDPLVGSTGLPPGPAVPPKACFSGGVKTHHPPLSPPPDSWRGEYYLPRPIPPRFRGQLSYRRWFGNPLLTPPHPGPCLCLVSSSPAHGPLRRPLPGVGRPLPSPAPMALKPAARSGPLNPMDVRAATNPGPLA